MYLFAGRDQLEEATATFERGVPRTAEQRRLAGHSGPGRAGGDPLAHRQHRPVHDELDR
jgi:hypothetical protein